MESDGVTAGIRGVRCAGPGGLQDPGRLRSFDPVLVGRLEAGAWAAYYRRDWVRLAVTAVGLVRVGFGMDWVRTVHGAWLIARANQLWAAGQPAGARRCMRRFYALLRLAYGKPDDPREAARLEVDWWAVHRAHERGADHDSGPLITALARLNAYLYHASEAEVRPAAEHRARAMNLSDEWVAAGCPPGSPLLPAVRAELVRSYALLLAAVHRPDRTRRSGS